MARLDVSVSCSTAALNFNIISSGTARRPCDDRLTIRQLL